MNSASLLITSIGGARRPLRGHLNALCAAGGALVRRSLARCSLLLLALSMVEPLHGQLVGAQPDSSVKAALAHIVDDRELASLRWPQLGDVADELFQFYSARDWAPAWSTGSVPTKSAAATLEVLRTIGTRGLDPPDYDVERLTQLAKARLTTDALRAEFDATLSTASLRALRSLGHGRVSATEAHADLRFPEDSPDYVPIIAALVTSPDPRTRFDEQEPPHMHYQLLKQELARYQARNPGDSVVRERIGQIALSMERWRWLPRLITGHPIIVNIPAFTLHAFTSASDSAADMLTMDAVVGNALFHRTPVFSDMLEYIEFAPYWNVPSSIASAELLPVAMRDPHLLTVNNYEIVSARGKVLPASHKTIKQVLERNAFIRQLPGGTNALGRVKFMFPNEFDVYLHDTPVTAAFLHDRRDLSHGCIRIAQPAALARLLLRDQPAWDSTAIASAMDGRTPVRVTLTHPVPVYVIYATAVAHEGRQVEFFDDIYGYDAELSKLIARGYPYQTNSGIAAARNLVKSTRDSTLKATRSAPGSRHERSRP